MALKTAFDFTELPDQFIRAELSIVGLRLKHELEGRPALELDRVKNKKTIATTRSFKNDISDLSELKERISTFADSCSVKLRKQNSHCNLLMVFIQTNSHRKEHKQYSKNINIKLPYPTNSSITISKYATKALEAIYKQGYKFKKVGVIVMGITPKDARQLKLFLNENPRHEGLMETIDKVNNHYGYKLLKLGSQNPKRTWILRQEKLSNKYTTSWNELLEVQ